MAHVHPHTPESTPVRAPLSPRGAPPTCGCSSVFLDLMRIYGGWINSIDEYDYEAALELMTQLREDAEVLANAEEQEAALVFANVFSASITYWRTQEVPVPLRIPKADATATLVYTHLRPSTPPHKSALFGSVVRLLTSAR